VATVHGVERFDGNTEPHVHFICAQCDSVEDLMQMQVPEALKGQAEECCGGKVETCQLCFTGLCAACKEEVKTGGATA